MPDKPESILQYVHRSNRVIGRTLRQIDLRSTSRIETTEKIAEMKRGLEVARLTLARCKTFPRW